ncbi:STAS domain-containing protein [Sphingosinicellaceae bacterium]|nr:STAS domain-containing protein [Sphingosinicellaceae bacterium]
MDWRQSTRGGAVVGEPHGRVDESNWEAFSGHLVAAITSAQATAASFIVDLSGIDYMSSRGLRALSTALAAAKAANVPMSLAAPGSAMRQILAISRYDKLFTVHDSVDAVAPA